MLRVLITPPALAEFDGSYRQILRDAGFELVFPERRVQLDEDDLVAELKDIRAVLAGSETYTRRVIDACPELHIIARQGVGFDAIDLGAATEHGIVVTTTPGSNHEAVAEHTFALMLALAKKLLPHDRQTRAGTWPRRSGASLRGRTLSIVGLGRIGKAVARRARAFDMRLLACEILPDRAFMKSFDIELLPYDEVVKDADYLTFHVPLTDDTRHMVKRRSLVLMKPTAFLINTSRGGVVCEADLLEALRRGQLAGAGLDVYECEPARDNPLFGSDRVVLSAHSAGIDERSRDDMARLAAEAIVSLSRGDWPAEKIVNPEVREHFSWPRNPKGT
jgi:phosphoglycerate dehydrogenase-like enzyme